MSLPVNCLLLVSNKGFGVFFLVFLFTLDHILLKLTFSLINVLGSKYNVLLVMAISADNRSVVCTSSLCLRYFIHCCHISLRFAGANAFSMVLILCRSYDLHGNR